MAKAKAEMAGLSSSAQREVNTVTRTMSDGGTVGGKALASNAESEVRKASPRLSQAGEDSGGALARGMEQGMVRNSPLIAAAIAGGLIAGAPLAIAGAGLLFGGIAAVAVHSNAEVSAAATGMTNAWEGSVKSAAAVTIPVFTEALQRLGAEARTLEPELARAFSQLGGPIDSLTTGVMSLASNAMPGLVRAVQVAGPVFQGLSSALGSIGTGLGDFFAAIAGHAPAAGQAMATIGQIIGELLPDLGVLLGEGAELASTVLPPLASVLHLVGDALNVVAPVLPGVALGFAAWKIVGTLDGPLSKFAGSLDTIGIKALLAVDNLTLGRAAGEAAAVGFGAAASGARTLEGAIGPIGWIMAGIGAVVPLLVSHFSDQDGMQKKVTDSAQAMTQALQQSKGAIDENVRATAAKQAQDDGLLAMSSKWGVSSSTIVDALLGQKGALEQVTAGANAYQTGLGQNTQAAYQNADALGTNTSAGILAAEAAGHTAEANDKATAASKSHIDALTSLAGTTTSQIATQQQLSDAINGATSATELNTQRLQGLASTAGGAQTQINLLKGALDALTGANVTMDQAQIAVTQAVSAASQAVQGHSAALTFNNGQLDLTNDKSAQAASLLMGLSGSQKQVIATAEQQGKTMGEVNGIADAQRQQFIQVAQQLGATAGQAQALADRYLGVPKDVHTEVTADTSQATAAAEALKLELAGIHDRKITVTTVNNVITSKTFGTLGNGVTMQASGGIVHMFAGGGFEPMRGGVAQVVPPGTLRVIGDNPTYDEAYIPINQSARSRSILEQTAARMGVTLGGGAGGGQASSTGRVINDNRVVHAYAFTPASLARELAQQQRDQEFLAGVA